MPPGASQTPARRTAGYPCRRRQAQARSATGQPGEAPLFGNPGFVVAGRGRPQPARPKRSIGPEGLHRPGQVRGRTLLELADRRQRLIRQLVDRPAQPELPARRDPAAVIVAGVNDPAPRRIALAVVIDVAEFVFPGLLAEAAREQGGSNCGAAPPGEDLGPESHAPRLSPPARREAS